MSKIIVLGAGMVGSAMAIDLNKKHEVTVTDVNEKALEKCKKTDNGLNTGILDVQNKKELADKLSSFDLVVCAVPGFLGFNTLKSIIEAGKNVVDISFFPEDALELRGLAEKHNVTALVDIGVAPGMDNLILGYYDSQMKLTDFECLVGGLPKVKKWPFCYKAPFSPVDVIEEYTRPARYVENGEIITREPLTDTEFVEFDKVGTLESFNSDGLRSIIQTMSHIPNMKEKTLRYPGHVEYIKVLKESGFFSQEKQSFKGTDLSPLDVTSQILFNEWKLGEDEEEFTVMRVMVQGTDDEGKMQRITYDLYDEYNNETSTSSMSRTTGYTATAGAELILQNIFSKKGLFPPELVGSEPGCFEFVLNYLKNRNVIYTKSVETLG